MITILISQVILAVTTFLNFEHVPMSMCHESGLRREKLVEVREVEKQTTHDIKSFLRFALSLPECFFLILK